MEQSANKEVVLGPKYLVRISDMRPEHWLRMYCRACRHVGFVTLDTLRRKRKPYERIMHLEPMFLCRACNTRGQVEWWVERRDLK